MELDKLRCVFSPRPGLDGRMPLPWIEQPFDILRQLTMR
jgi:hypothetical protein